MKKIATLLFCLILSQIIFSQNIPLPEHPRPDWQRNAWLNLNGDWQFAFDKEDIGLKQGWANGNQTFPLKIHVPFPWGAPLSGVKDEADIAWYQRTVAIPKDWKGQRIFLIIGASDYKTTVWANGKELGSHEGGYTPFEFELSNIKVGANAKIVIRVDDVRREYALYGKQGYGNARGIWQTVYLEARPPQYLETVHFTPDIDNKKVTVEATLPTVATQNLDLVLSIDNKTVSKTINKGQNVLKFDVPIPNPNIWGLETPFLYEVKAELKPSRSKLKGDIVNTYFGMRKISVVNLPNTQYSYVALNNQPIYLQLALDQSYHPEGYYTFPSDEFMKNEIKLAKDIGLNGIRTHIKIDIPRKLYWADKLGLLVMSDLPNFWSEPTAQAKQESEKTLPKLIKRDFNHPAIFSWVVFNEQWGLHTKVEENGKKVNKYLPETQKWVADMYHKAKVLDPTRLVEDNSPCCGGGHTETDINSWHEYLPGYDWEKRLKEISEKTHEGSTWNFEKGYQQGKQPNINSEFGNVWGYDGSSGDVDWTWDYHKAVNEYRKNPAIAGWLYTEHHDVINEWNGYWKYDRSLKITGLGDLVKGMSLKDFHSEFYISTGQEISKTVKNTEGVLVPLTISAMTGRTDVGKTLTLKAELYGWNAIGEFKRWQNFTQKIDYQPYMQKNLESLNVKMPDEKGVAILALILEDANGKTLNRNFTTFVIEKQTSGLSLSNGQKARLVNIEPQKFSEAKWSQKQWNVLEGLKVNGAGTGFFEYKIKLPKDIKKEDIAQASFIVEASAKQLFGKDREGAKEMTGDYMLGGGTNDPSRNPNAYPMTDERKFPSAVNIIINGQAAGQYNLEDDPADHRGILSWHNQPRDRKLREAGSYGYKIEAKIPQNALDKAFETGELIIRLNVENNGGLAIYGEKMGRYPFDPTVVFVLK